MRVRTHKRHKTKASMLAAAEVILKFGNVYPWTDDQSRFTVESASSANVYEVELIGGKLKCSCPRWLLHGKWCKHGFACLMFSRGISPVSDDEEPSSETSISSTRPGIDLSAKGKAGKKKKSSQEIKSYKKRGKKKSKHYTNAFPETPSPRKKKVKLYTRQTINNFTAPIYTRIKFK